MLAQIHAWRDFWIYLKDQTDVATIEKEISELKFAIELMKG